MSDLLIRHIPKDTMQLAKKIASRNHRSVQEEISQLIIRAVRFYSGDWSRRAENIYKLLDQSKKKQSDTIKLLHEDRYR